jgi:hypothetical protein
MWKVGVATLLLAAFVSVLVVLTTSWKSAKTLTVAEITVPVRVPQYGLENFASDLRALQSFMSKTKFIDQKVAYTGEQSRVFKFAVATLAPETCTAITSLAVKSYDPSMGFTLKATCLVSSEKAASLEILWKGRYAELFLTGRDRSERLSVMIHPPKGTGATEPGQQTQPAQPDYNMGPLDGQPAINI